MTPNAQDLKIRKNQLISMTLLIWSRNLQVFSTFAQERLTEAHPEYNQVHKLGRAVLVNLNSFFELEGRQICILFLHKYVYIFCEGVRN